jgi:hypothetical protein
VSARGSVSPETRLASCRRPSRAASKGSYTETCAEYFISFATHLRYPFTIEPEYFEISFSKGSTGLGEAIKVYIQLNQVDGKLMRLGGSVELRTRAIVRRAKILHLLPEGFNEEWPLSGRILENGERCSWREKVEPKTQSTTDGHT